MSAPMDSHVVVRALEPVPRQDFLGPTADELHSGHVGKGMPKVTAIRT